MISTQFLNDCLAGNEEAIQQLIRAYQRQVFQLVLSVLDDADAPVEQAMLQAEIATRETFVAVLEKLGSYREDTPFPIWLFRTAVKVARQRSRVWRRERGLRGVFVGAKRRVRAIFLRGPGLPEGADFYGQPEPPAEKRDASGLWQAVRKLDEKLRIPVVLRYYHDFSLEEIAGILKLSEGTIHARLDKARELLAFRSVTPPVEHEPAS